MCSWALGKIYNYDVSFPRRVAVAQIGTMMSASLAARRVGRELSNASYTRIALPGFVALDIAASAPASQYCFKLSARFRWCPSLMCLVCKSGAKLSKYGQYIEYGPGSQLSKD